MCAGNTTGRFPLTCTRNANAVGSIKKYPGHLKTPDTCSIGSKQISQKLYPETSSNHAPDCDIATWVNELHRETSLFQHSSSSIQFL